MLKLDENKNLFYQDTLIYSKIEDFLQISDSIFILLKLDSHLQNSNHYQNYYHQSANLPKNTKFYIPPDDTQQKYKIESSAEFNIIKERTGSVDQQVVEEEPILAPPKHATSLMQNPLITAGSSAIYLTSNLYNFSYNTVTNPLGTVKDSVNFISSTVSDIGAAVIPGTSKTAASTDPTLDPLLEIDENPTDQALHIRPYQGSDYLLNLAKNILTLEQFSNILAKDSIDISKMATVPAVNEKVTEMADYKKSFAGFSDLKSKVVCVRLETKNGQNTQKSSDPSAEAPKFKVESCNLDFFELKGVIKFFQPPEFLASEYDVLALTCSYVIFGCKINPETLELASHNKITDFSIFEDHNQMILPKLENFTKSLLYLEEDQAENLNSFYQNLINFSENERYFYKSLTNLKKDILSPLKYSEKAKTWSAESKNVNRDVNSDIEISPSLQTNLSNLEIFEKMIEKFEILFNAIGIQARESTLQLINLAELQKRGSVTDGITLEQTKNLLTWPILIHPENFLNRFKDYAKILNDALAFGTLQELEPKILQNSGEKLYQILYRPINQLQFYLEFFEKVKFSVQDTQLNFKDLTYQINQSIQLIIKDKNSAEVTELYYQNAENDKNFAKFLPIKLKNNGQRRYIYDSRKMPCSISNSIFGVSENMVLFDDILLVHKASLASNLLDTTARLIPFTKFDGKANLSGGISSQNFQFSLKTLFIEDNLDDNNSLKLLTPEETLIMSFDSVGETGKSYWLKHLSMYTSLQNDNLTNLSQWKFDKIFTQKPDQEKSSLKSEQSSNVSSRRSSTDSTSQKTSEYQHFRHTDYTFSKTHKFYANATYSGYWNHKAEPTGPGLILFQNGDRLKAEFLNGVAEGFGIYTCGSFSYADQFQEGASTTDTKKSKQIYYSGMYKNGLQDGLGVAYYQEFGQEENAFKIVYEGYFKEGQRHGHGLLHKFYKNFTTINIGNFSQDLPNGYGIYEKVYLQDKGAAAESTASNSSESFHYLGMFKNGVPEGKGSYINSKIYYQINTQNNESIIAENNKFFTGFSSTDADFSKITLNCTGHKHKGKLKLNNGLDNYVTLEGNFTGNWNNEMSYSGTLNTFNSVLVGEQVSPETGQVFQENDSFLLNYQSHLDSLEGAVPANERWSELFSYEAIFILPVTSRTPHTRLFQKIDFSP